MSRKPKNNHYHYAEKFEDRRRMRVSDVLKAPRKAFTLAFLALLAFGLISTTFAAYISSEDFTENNNGSIIINTRNTIAEREGVSAQKDDSDLAGTGAEADMAETGTNIGSTSFYYAGSNNSWSLTAMTKHSSGYYSYAAVGAGTQFKVSSSSSSYTYDGALGFDFYGMSGVYSRYTDSAWKTTSDTSNNTLYRYNDGNSYPCHDPGDSYNGTGDNFYVKNAGYVLVWYANTDLRENAKPMITVVSSLPSGPKYQVHYSTGSWTQTNMTTSSNPVTESSQWTATINLAAGSYEFEIQKVFSDTYPNKATIYYKNNGTMKYNNCSSWNFTSTESNHAWINTVISGYYTFTLTETHWYDKTCKLSVTYPKYTVTTSKNISAAASTSPTPASSTVNIGNSVNLSAPEAVTGYEFVNWTISSGAATTVSYGGTAFSSSTSRNVTIYPSGSSDSVAFVANYKVKEYTITYSKGSTSGITGTVGAGTKQYNVGYTITSSTFTRNGYTQVGWSTTENATSIGYSFGSTYTANANLTLYPVWSINAPTVSITGTTHTAGGSASTLTSSATHASGLSVTKTYTITAGPSGSILPGTQGQTANCGITSGGAFTAEIPGTYTVSLTGTVSNSSTTNGSASATTTCTVTVVPAKPSLTLTLNGYSGEGTGTQASPFKIILGETYNFSAAVDDPKAGYTYSWSKTGEDGTWNNFSGELDPYQSPTYSSTTTPTTVNGNDTISFQSVTPNEPCDAVSFTLYLKTEMNGQSASADPVTVYYFVEPLIKTFDFLPVQKIYNERFDNSRINVEYNLSNATGYTTTMYFSSDNSSYYPIQRKSNEFITSFENTLKNYFYPRGVKYFKMSITKGNLQSSQMLHTTVGTDDKDAVRPFYFINGVSGLDLSNYRVVAYWADADSPSGYSYQTAQDIYKGVTGKTEGVRYRINLPSDAADVVFAVANKDYYGTPTYDEGVYTFMNPDAQTTFFYYYTENVILGDENCYTVNSSDGASLPMLSGSLGYFNAE